MADIKNLADSFDLPGVDRSKWTVLSTSSYQLVAPYGIKFTTGATGQVSRLDSVDSFTLFGSNTYINFDAYLHWNAYANFCVFDPVNHEEFGFDINGLDTLTSGDVASAGDVTLKAKGAKWAVNRWVNARVWITSGPGNGETYNILSNSEDELQLDSDGWNTLPTSSSNYRIEAITLSLYHRSAGGTFTTFKKIYLTPGQSPNAGPSIASNIRWLRIRDTKYADRIYYDTSSDGVTWNNAYFMRKAPISTTRKFKARIEFWKKGTNSYAAPEWLLVKLFNTRKPVYRAAPGQYLSNDFQLMPVKEFGINVQWDVFKRLTGTTSARIDSERRLAVRGGIVRSSLKTTIRDVDFRFDARISATSATMLWRMNDAGTTYVGLQILPTQLIVHTVVNGVRADKYTFSSTQTADVTYQFRVVHAGTTVVVYRNGGDYTSTQTITFPEELFRVPSVVVPGVDSKGNPISSAKGHVGILASTSDVFTDNWVVRPGTTPPPLVWTPDANLPAVITNPLVLPPGYPPAEDLLSGRVTEMRLVETGYADLILYPTPAFYSGYGGVFPQEYDLGEPTYKEFVEDLSGAPGTRDYTSQHGAKVVTMTLAAVPGILPGTTETTVNYLVDLVARWCAPHRRPRLFYKPADGAARYIDLVPTPLGRPVTIEQANNYTVINMSFKAPMGIEEDVTPEIVDIDTDFEPTTVLNMGTKAALPIIRIYGPSSNPVLYNDSLDYDGNARLGLTMEIEDGEFIELDTRNKTVRYMGSPDPAANRRDKLTIKGWFPLTPFLNAIRLESDDGLGFARLTYRNTW